MNSNVSVRYLSLGLLVGTATYGQVRLHLGVEAGSPFRDSIAGSSTFSALASGTIDRSDSFSSNTKRLLIGPTIRLELPFGLGVEVDGLYQRINYEHTYTQFQGTAGGTNTFVHNTADTWQVPLLVQYGLKFPLIKPFVEAGPALSYVAGGDRLKVALQSGPFAINSVSETDQLIELHHNPVFGVTAGFGVDLHPKFLHIRPEVRYVRWGAKQFSALSDQAEQDRRFAQVFPLGQPTLQVPSIFSKRDQIDFLLGITF